MSLPLFAVMSPSGVRRWMISVEVAASINTMMMIITRPTLAREPIFDNSFLRPEDSKGLVSKMAVFK